MRILDKNDNAEDITDDDRRYLSGKPGYCYALPSRLSAFPLIKKGVWLIIVYCPWSLSDLQSRNNAYILTKKWKGRLNLGVRCVQYLEDKVKFSPEINSEFISPEWLIIIDGVVKKHFVRPKTSEELEELIHKSLS